jgi:endonuclease/exonuclease/phosphatase family metal-dependent hydrolase
MQVRSIIDVCRDEGWIDGWFKGIVILAGDLNAEPGALELNPLNGVPFSDPGRDLPGRATHKSGLALDHILLSPDADMRYVVGSVTIYRDPPASQASDHYPIYLDLRY